jgi:prevent-host-death family protein
MKVTISEAREKLSDLINEVAFGKKEFILTRRGKSLAPLVPLDENNNIAVRYEDNKAIKPASNKAIKE